MAVFYDIDYVRWCLIIFFTTVFHPMEAYLSSHFLHLVVYTEYQYYDYVLNLI